MKKTGLLTKVLAIVGAVLVWFPIVATVVTAAAGSIRSRTLRFDYLMPAELFPVVLAGAGLLLWAALRARSRRELIGWGLAMMLALLVGGQVVASATGLASGETEPAGWPWVWLSRRSSAIRWCSWRSASPACCWSAMSFGMEGRMALFCRRLNSPKQKASLCLRLFIEIVSLGCFTWYWTLCREPAIS